MIGDDMGLTAKDALRLAGVIAVWAFVAWFGWNAIERHNDGVLICYVIVAAVGVAALANWIWKQATRD